MSGREMRWCSYDDDGRDRYLEVNGEIIGDVLQMDQTRLWLWDRDEGPMGTAKTMFGAMSALLRALGER